MAEEKEYKVTFTTDYGKFRENPNNARNVVECDKWRGKTVKLSELPAFVEEVGEVILSRDEVEIYNNYRE